MPATPPAGRIASLRRMLPVLLLVGCWFVAGAARAEGAAAASPEPAELKVANRTIQTLRANSFGRPPRERAQAIESLISTLVEHGGPLEVTTLDAPEGVLVLIDGSVAYRVLKEDVNPETGETPRAVADSAVRNLRIALAELQEARDARALLPGVLHSLAATAVATLVLWLLWRSFRWLSTRLRAVIRRRAEQLVPRWGWSIVGPSAIEKAAIAPLHVTGWLLAFLVACEWLVYVLSQFPYSRPWGEALFANLAGAIGEIVRGIANALPGLFFVAVIFYLTRLVARAVRSFFAGVEQGRIHVQWVDETTARPTARLINAVVWLFGFVAAYPYIPGSDSEAFKGIGVFVGLMLSIGSSGIVNQAVSGLMLMYTRALRPGEFVQIGETEGVVRSVGFVNTRIETLRHEEISIPNAVIAATVTRNYSRLAGDGGVWVPTKVTIGYDTPWRQVHALLLLAAERTQSVARSPEPRVLQTALQDFYVEYTLLVTVMDPSRRLVVLDELHANIQDVFNEHGVQIMSPNYVADPASPKVVPPEDWYKAPAQR